MNAFLPHHTPRPTLGAALTVLLLVIFAVPVQATPSMMRIRLIEQYTPKAITLSGVQAPLLVLDAQQRPLQRIQGPVSVSAQQGQVKVNIQGRMLMVPSIIISPENDAEFVLNLTSGSKSLKPRRYTGSLVITADRSQPNALKIVNHIGLEEYVANIVSTEYGLQDMEGSKAMAVVARTYAIRGRRSYDGTYDHVDHTMSQYYEGTSRLTPLAQEAARATAGEVLTYKGQLIESVYYSSSGGHTADNETVWSANPLPYLRGKADPYDSQSPHYRWTNTIAAQQLLAALSEKYRASIVDVRVGSRNKDGRASTMVLVRSGGRDAIMPANKFRTFVSKHFGYKTLKSTYFEMSRKGSSYEFSGRGFGHGVGMSQYGAHEMAKQGYTYRDILGFYYTNVTLRKLGYEGQIHLASTPGAPQVTPVGHVTVGDATGAPSPTPQVAVVNAGHQPASQAAAQPAPQPVAQAPSYAPPVTVVGGPMSHYNSNQPVRPKPRRRTGW